jgi:alpha-galactosidase
MQAQTHALAAWFPFYGVFGVVSGSYHTRSCYSPSFGTWVPGNLETDDAKRTEVRRAFEECSKVAPCMLGDYYPLTPYSRADDVWIAWQFDRPESGDGVVQAFRRGQSSRDSICMKLHGLEPDAMYSLTNFDVAGTKEKAGRELIDQGLCISIPDRPSSALTAYRKIVQGAETPHLK